MMSGASSAAFALKITLFMVECFKWTYTYDFAPIYDQIKEKYVNADSSKLPGAKKLPKSVPNDDENTL